MGVSLRVVLPETLDSLDPSDPRARRARQDLRRVHAAMRTVSILRRAVKRLSFAAQPCQILELGGGDGSLILRLAQSIRPQWRNVTLTLLDRHDIVSPQTLSLYKALDWRVKVVQQDVMEWALEPHSERYDLALASLFLHHFDDRMLALLLRAVAARCDAFVACEPRRSAMAALGSSMIGILGTSQVTREDAVTSVAAGFTRQELTAFWPDEVGRWSIEEYVALPFTHCFTAGRERRAMSSTAS
jgi:hypothetical protein